MALTTFLPPLRSGFLYHFEGNHLLGNHGEERFANLLSKGIYEHMQETKNIWKGCFGMCGIFSQKDLTIINDSFPIFTREFLQNIQTRTDRMAMERIFGWVCCTTKITKCSFGDIHTFPTAFYPSSDSDAVNDLEQRIQMKSNVIVKVWRSR